MDEERAKNLVKDVFESKFDERKFEGFIANLLKKYDRSKFLKKRSGSQVVREKYLDFIGSWERLGRYIDSEKNVIDILIVYLKKGQSLYRSRVAQRNFVADYLSGKVGTDSLKDAALVAFVSPRPWQTCMEEDWRFSLVKLEYKKEGGKLIDELSPAKRWSFLVGKNEKSHTAQSRFLGLLKSDEEPTLKEIQKAFDIETITDEFFEKYRDLFIKTKIELDNIVKKDEKLRKEFKNKNISTVDFAKKLLGQIVFLYFLQKKGWFGVEKGKDFGTGPKDFIRKLFNGEYISYKNFYNDVLEPLFYKALRDGRSSDDHYYDKLKCKIPFLNGGLFDPPNDFDWVKVDIPLPNDLFSNNHKTDEGDIGDGILDVFDRYNFTVNEEEPLEKEVALDPELLGKIYEKLNAIREDNFDEYLKALKSSRRSKESKFNKEYGVYYTPREIVHYMCQESLLYYLESQLEEQVYHGSKIGREDLEKFIKYADLLVENEKVAQEKVENNVKASKYKYEIPESIVKNAKEIDKLLNDLKICDPAVGSGAFLVGMLHEIVKLRQLLSVYTKNNLSNYDLKRHTIENSLYGVDIDPGAVEVCKLRFWLSLIVDEDSFNDIKPLPNLDYKIVRGNSLIGFPNNWRSDIADKIEKLEDKLFSETHPERKKEIKKELDALILKRLENSKEIFGYKVDFDFKLFFPQVYHNQKVFKEKSGFDIVIGNPPYVRHEKIRAIKPILERQNYEVFTSTADLYVYFYEKGYQLLKDQGILAYITSNKWMRAKYGEKLRKFLKEKTAILEIIDFSGYSVFEQTVDTNILIFRKENDRGRLVPRKEHIFRFLEVKGGIEDIEEYLRRKGKPKLIGQATEKKVEHLDSWPQVDTWQELRTWQTMYQSKLSDNAWTLGDESVLSLKDKIEKAGKPLKDWDVKIYYGIKTGFNEAFIIDSEKRDEILRNCKTEEERKRTEEIIKPVLRGRDIDKYMYKWAGLWIIGTFPAKNLNIDNYPALKEYLGSFGDRLLQDGKPGHRKRTSNKWFETQDNIAYYPEFEKEKIVWQEMSLEPSFAYDDKKFYTNQTAYIMTGKNLKFILGLLNSKISKWYMQSLAYSLSEGAQRWIKQYVELIPLPPITKENKPLVDQVIQKVDQILTLTQSKDYDTNQEKQEHVKRLQHEIDKLVYKLYGLTEEEIKIIEGS